MGGAIVTNDPLSGLNLSVERWSASSSGSLRDLGGLLPLGFAFAAGMVSAVNPCGFSLLPAYLGLFLGERDDVARSSLARLRRGLLVGLTVSLGFVSLFTLVGLLLGAGAQLLVEWLPWIGMLIGVALIVAGGYRLAGGALYASAPERLGARVGGDPDGGLRGYFLFGLSYGIASLSCTLPIFLAVVGGTLTTARLFPMVSALSLYALGMGSVILALTLAIAVFRVSPGRWIPPCRPVRGADRHGRVDRGRDVHRLLLADHRRACHLICWMGSGSVKLNHYPTWYECVTTRGVNRYLGLLAGAVVSTLREPWPVHAPGERRSPATDRPSRRIARCRHTTARAASLLQGR